MHIDSRDSGYTLVHFRQKPSSPVKSRPYFYLGSQWYAIHDGMCAIFDGSHMPHGTYAPQNSDCKDWYGLAMVLPKKTFDIAKKNFGHMLPKPGERPRLKSHWYAGPEPELVVGGSSSDSSSNSPAVSIEVSRTLASERSAADGDNSANRGISDTSIGTDVAKIVA